MTARRTALVTAVFCAMGSASFTGEVVLSGVKFDFRELKGDHSVSVLTDTPPTTTNMTWSLNPVGPLTKDSDSPSDHQCPLGTQICGIERIKSDDGTVIVDKIIPIAGDIHGRSSDPRVTRLAEREGVDGIHVEIGGGEYKDIKQSAGVDFICKTDSEEGPKEGLRVKSYTDNKLTLEWITSYACPRAADKPAPPPSDETKSSSWGVFTWLVLIIFIAIAAYLILGSFFNYNRYGSTGFDLLPHSETLRDLPFLVKDWFGAVVTTFKGGARGGYTSV